MLIKKSLGKKFDKKKRISYNSANDCAKTFGVVLSICQHQSMSINFSYSIFLLVVFNVMKKYKYKYKCVKFCKNYFLKIKDKK